MLIDMNTICRGYNYSSTFTLYQTEESEEAYSKLHFMHIRLTGTLNDLMCFGFNKDGLLCLGGEVKRVTDNIARHSITFLITQNVPNINWYRQIYKRKFFTADLGDIVVYDVQHVYYNRPDWQTSTFLVDKPLSEYNHD